MSTPASPPLFKCDGCGRFVNWISHVGVHGGAVWVCSLGCVAPAIISRPRRAAVDRPTD